MITQKNVLNHEIIGLKVKVSNSPIKGEVVDETKNTFMISTSKGEKTVPKKGNKFEIELDKKCVIDGEMITQRPYERLKKKYKVKNKWQKTLV